MGLFKPAWQSAKVEKALGAVEKETEQTKLKEIAAKAWLPAVRKAADKRLCVLFGHEWDGCKCRRCGVKRDEQHEWKGCRCARCGARRDEQHRWQGLRCLECGKERSVTEIDDPPTLAAIAKADANRRTSIDAVSKLDDISLLIDVAKNAQDSTSGGVAYYRLWEHAQERGDKEIFSLLITLAEEGKNRHHYTREMEASSRGGFVDCLESCGVETVRMILADCKHGVHDVRCDEGKIETFTVLITALYKHCAALREEIERLDGERISGYYARRMVEYSNPDDNFFLPESLGIRLRINKTADDTAEIFFDEFKE